MSLDSRLNDEGPGEYEDAVRVEEGEVARWLLQRLLRSGLIVVHPVLTGRPPPKGDAVVEAVRVGHRQLVIDTEEYRLLQRLAAGAL